MVAYNKVVLSGTLGVTAEQWSCGIAYWSDLVEPHNTAQELQTWADNIAASFTAIPLDAALRTAMSVQASLNQIRTYFYAAPGADAGAVGLATLAQAGTATSTHPYPTSVVCSLQTGFAGRRNRGRIYWPGLGITIGGNGRLSGTDAQALAGAFSTMLVRIGLENELPDPFLPAVVSVAGGTVTTVTSVRVGDVPDTQRRRRNALVESYKTATVS